MGVDASFIAQLAILAPECAHFVRRKIDLRVVSAISQFLKCTICFSIWLLVKLKTNHIFGRGFQYKLDFFDKFSDPDDLRIESVLNFRNFNCFWLVVVSSTNGLSALTLDTIFIFFGKLL